MQPNQELNALIITDETHRKHKDMQLESRQEAKMMKTDFKLALNEEDFKAKELEIVQEERVREVPKMPEIDMKLLPTFKDAPLENEKSGEIATNKEEFMLMGKQWPVSDWWRQMDVSDENLMYELGMFASAAGTDCPLFQIAS
jgi:hypothetical protein